MSERGEPQLIPGSPEMPPRTKCPGCGQEVYCFHIIKKDGNLARACGWCIREGREPAAMVGMTDAQFQKLHRRAYNPPPITEP